MSQRELFCKFELTKARRLLRCLHLSHLLKVCELPADGFKKKMLIYSQPCPFCAHWATSGDPLNKLLIHLGKHVHDKFNSVNQTA